DAGGAFFQQGICSVAERAAGIDDVVEQYAVLAVHVADDVHHFRLAGALAALVDDGKLAVDPLRQRPVAHDAAYIRRHDHDVGNLLVFRLDVARHHGDGEKVVGGNVEEALNLAGVQVHGQNPVGTRLCDEICHQLGRNGRATGSPAVLSGVAEIGDDGSNAPRRRPSERIDHDQQFHQVVV